VDTATKRASVLSFGFPFGWVLPVPDGTVAQADRQHLLGYYGGIVAEEAAVDTVESATGSTRLPVTVTVSSRKMTVTQGARFPVTVTVGARS